MNTENITKHVPDTSNLNPQSDSKKEKQSYSAWAKDAYNNQYESWMPWIEDQYLKWFGKGDNKASYATKDTLSKGKVTGIDQVDQVQDDVSNLVGNQVGDKGLLSPVGKAVSKEGINRAERGGKDDKGEYLGGLDGVATGSGNASSGGNPVTGVVGQGVSRGVDGVKGVTTGIFGGKN